MPNGFEFGNYALTEGVANNTDVPQIIITPSGDVLGPGGEILHSAGGGRGQGGPGGTIVFEKPPLNGNDQIKPINILLGFFALKYLGVF